MSLCHLSHFPSPSRPTPHPGIGARMLRYQVSYPILPFMQPHLTPYLSRQNDHDSCPRKPRQMRENQGRQLKEKGGALVSTPVSSPRSASTTRTVKTAYTHCQTLSTPTTCLLAMSTSSRHECERMPRTAKTTPKHDNDQNDSQDNPHEHECGQPTPP